MVYGTFAEHTEICWPWRIGPYDDKDSYNISYNDFDNSRMSDWFILYNHRFDDELLDDDLGWHLTFDRIDSENYRLILRPDPDENVDFTIHLKLELFIMDGNELKYVQLLENVKTVYKTSTVTFKLKEFVTKRKYKLFLKCEIRPECFEGFCKYKVFKKGIDIPKLKLKNMFETGKYSDFKLISSDNEELLTHRCILRAASPVFEEMMLPNINEIIIGDLDGKTLKEMLFFIYNDTFQSTEIDNIIALLKASLKFDLPKLKYCCVKYLDENYTHVNVLKVLNVANQCNEEVLMKNCIQYIKMNYAWLKSHGDWSLIDSKVFLKIMDTLQEDPIKVIKFPYYYDRTNRFLL